MALHSHFSLLGGGKAAVVGVVGVGVWVVTTTQCCVCLGSVLTEPISGPLVAPKLRGEKQKNE